MKHLAKIVAAPTLFLCVQAFATPPIPNTIRVEGQEYPLFADPLTALLHDDKEISKLISERHNRLIRCSAPNSGYKTQWQIREDNLFLTGISFNPCDRNSPEVPLGEIFSGENSPKKANWFNGKLFIPQGEVIRPVSIGIPRYEKDIIYTFAQGTVTQREERYNTAYENDDRLIQKGFLYVTLYDTPASTIARLPKRPPGRTWRVTNHDSARPAIKAWIAELEKLIQSPVKPIQDKRIPPRELYIEAPEFPLSIIEPGDKRAIGTSLNSSPAITALDIPLLSTDQVWVLHVKHSGLPATQAWTKELESILQKRAAALRDKNPPTVEVLLKQDENVLPGEAIITPRP